MTPTPNNAKPARKSDMTEVKVPTLGESITEATLGAWLKQPGEAVAQDEPIASLETDKVAVEVPSPVAGTMGDQLVKVGDTVAVGAVIANINAGAAATPGNPPGPGETPAPKPVEQAPAEPAPAPSPVPAPAPAQPKNRESQAVEPSTNERNRKKRSRQPPGSPSAARAGPGR